MNAMEQPMKKKRGRKPTKNKRPEDMPTRPLSAYNYFFREQRVLWLDTKPDVLDKTKEFAPEPDGRKVKSRLFETMAKEIARRWKEIPPSIRQRYVSMAEQDMKRYRSELEQYQNKIAIAVAESGVGGGDDIEEDDGDISE